MTGEVYSIDELVSDLRQVLAETADEREILRCVRPLARRAALAKDSWLEKRHYTADPKQGFGLHLLHEEPDHALWLLKRLDGGVQQVWVPEIPAA